MEQSFLVDVHSDFSIYLEDPAPYIPQKKSNRGPKIKKLVSDAESFGAKDVISSKALDDQPVIKLRDTSRGPLRVRAYSRPVYMWDGESSRVDKWLLVVTKSLGHNGDIKISVASFDGKTSLKSLAWRQRQRYWVERAFEDGKSEGGMADYQVRNWNGWHHHMALVMMAMLFMLTERIMHKGTYPLLSCIDIEELLSKFCLAAILRSRRLSHNSITAHVNARPLLILTPR